MDPIVLQAHPGTGANTDDDRSQSESKIKHGGHVNGAKESSSEPAPTHATTFESLRPLTVQGLCINDSVTSERNTTASGNMTRDQLSDSTVRTDNSTANMRTTKIATESTSSCKAKASNDHTTAGQHGKPPLAHFDGQSNQRIISQAALGTHSPVAQAEKPMRAGDSNAPDAHTVSSEATISTTPTSMQLSSSSSSARVKRPREHDLMLPKAKTRKCPEMNRRDVAPGETSVQTPTESSSLTPVHHVGNSAVDVQKSPTPAGTSERQAAPNEKRFVSNAEAYSQALIATSSRTGTSQPLETSTSRIMKRSYTVEKSVQWVQGPGRSSTVYPPHPPLDPRTGQLSNTHAQGSILRTILPSSAESDDVARWKSTPFTLVPVAGNVFCPRLIIDPPHQLHGVFGPGQHCLGPAIAKIHAVMNEKKKVPLGFRRVLQMFDSIHRDDMENGSRPPVTLLDPQLYRSSKGSHFQLEYFRQQEWGWLTRIGQSYQFGPVLGEERWNLESVEVNYEKLECALTLRRGSDLIIWKPGQPHDNPHALSYTVQVRLEPLILAMGV